MIARLLFMKMNNALVFFIVLSYQPNRVRYVVVMDW
jgi:hypothetical protein